MIFDNVTVTFYSGATITEKMLFYHCDLTIPEDIGSFAGKMVASNIQINAWNFKISEYYFYYCKVTSPDAVEYRDILVPLDILIKRRLQYYARQVLTEGKTYPVDHRDSGNALHYDARYSLLEDIYVPFASINGDSWTKGYDMNAETGLDFLFQHESNPDRRLRDMMTFSSGDYVGKYVSVLTQETYEPNNDLASYILGLFPEEIFVPENVIKISGLYDNYTTGMLPALWGHNDKEFRTFLRSLATTMGRTSGNLLMMKLSIENTWKDYNDQSPDSFQHDLNKVPTWRIGKSWITYNPAIQKFYLSASSGLPNVPFYWTDENQRFEIVRIYPLADAGADVFALQTYAVWFNLLTELDVVEVAPAYGLSQGIQLILNRKAVYRDGCMPLCVFNVDASNEIHDIMFFCNALIGADWSLNFVFKHNVACRLYATKSRSANLFTNYNEIAKFYSDYKILIEKIFNKGFAADNRMFVWYTATYDIQYVEEIK